MKISKQNRRDAKQLFRACVTNGVLDENRVRSAVDEVLAQKPRGYLGVLDHLTRLVKLEQIRRTATVESAVALTPELQAQFKTGLEQRYGKGLNFVFTQNAALIGGVRLQVGSDVYDASIQARLNHLRESF